MCRKILVMLAVLGVVLGSGIVSAMGLGQIKVQSALNQILQAEIELSGIQADQIDEIKVELASQRVFERLGIPRSFELTRLQFEPKLVGGNPIIKVTSKDPIREPFLTFLVQVQWSKGKLLREYTVLLDPPVFGRQAQAQLSQATTTTASSNQKEPSKPAGSEQEKPVIQQNPSSRQAAKAVKEKTPPPAGDLPDEYQAERGDTLWGISKDLVAGTELGINQMMVAIQNSNPAAFVENNINNLKAGQILRVPTQEQAAQLSEKQATAQVKKQWLEWQQSRQVAAADPVPQVPARDQLEQPVMNDAAKSTTAESEQPKAGAELSIVSNDDGVQGDAGGVPSSEAGAAKKLQNELVLLREQAFAKDKENEELQSRVADLESLLKKQERIITLQNQKLDQLQAGFSEDVAAVDREATATAEVVADEPEAQQQAAAQSDLSAVETAVVEPLPEFEEPVPGEFADLENELFGEDKSSTVTDTKAESTPNTVEEEIVEPASDVAPVTVEPVQTEPVVEAAGWMDKAKSVLSQVVDTFKSLGRNAIIGIVGMLAIILGWLAYKRRRNSGSKLAGARAMPPADEFDDPQEEAILDETIVASADEEDRSDDLNKMDLDKEETVVSSKKGQAVKGDEVIEEADVYLSYSLFQQAEDLLNDAVEKNPENLEYKVKLAEVLAAAEKKDEFVQNAEKVRAQAGETSEAWKRVAAMGTAVAPSAALFSGVVASESAMANAVQTPEPKSPDFALDEEEDRVPDDDMGLDFSLGANADDAELQEDIPAQEDAWLNDAGASAADASMDEASTDDEEDVFLDFNADDLEQELTNSMSAESDIDDQDDELSMQEASDSTASDDQIETAMFDRNAIDENAIDVSEDMTKEIDVKDLTRELETFSFDSNEFDATSLPEMETQELSTSAAEAAQSSANDTSTLSAEMFDGEATEQFDISNIDTQTVDLNELRERSAAEDDADDMEMPSVIEEAGTKLDLAKAFVDMGDPDAARETLSEVMEQGDDDQIKEARALLDRIS